MDKTVSSDSLEAEDLVGGNFQGVGEGGDESAVHAKLPALVLRDDGLVDAELDGQLVVSEPVLPQWG